LRTLQLIPGRAREGFLGELLGWWMGRSRVRVLSLKAFWLRLRGALVLKSCACYDRPQLYNPKAPPLNNPPPDAFDHHKSQTQLKARELHLSSLLNSKQQPFQIRVLFSAYLSERPIFSLVCLRPHNLLTAENSTRLRPRFLLLNILCPASSPSSI
jgi:hypothetical protein